MVLFCDSACDRPSPSPAGSVVRPFACDQCSRAFPSRLALRQHARVAHGVCCTYRLVAPRSGTCPVCGTQFRQRLRLLAHLRRYACGRTLAERPSDFPRLSEAEAAALDVEDNVLYRDAYFHGSRTPKACGEARRADGSVIGSARR